MVRRSKLWNIPKTKKSLNLMLRRRWSSRVTRAGDEKIPSSQGFALNCPTWVINLHCSLWTLAEQQQGWEDGRNGDWGSQVTPPVLCPGPVVMVVPPGTDWECTGSKEGKIHRKKKFQKLNKVLLSSQSVLVFMSNYIPYMILPWS